MIYLANRGKIKVVNKELKMAEGTITHFKEFDPDSSLIFSQRVFEAIGSTVYGFKPEEVTEENVTLIVIQAESGSRTSATACTEVKIDIEADEWPKDALGLFLPIEVARERCHAIKQNVGRLLIGGVNNEDGKLVNVWTRLIPITGWYGVNYQC